MPFIPHTEADVKAMLAAIGVASIDQLFEEIPERLRAGKLTQVPEGLSEMDVARLMTSRANQDGSYLNFLGAGAYEHHIPAAVWRSLRAASFIPPTRRTRPRRARARCNCCTNTRP